MRPPLAYAALIVLGLAQAVVWIVGVPDDAGTFGFGWRSLPLFGMQVAAVALMWRRRDRAAIVAVVGFAIAFRIAALSWSPVLSSDLYRYVWDGRVTASGTSPYASPPDGPDVAHMRDSAIWPNINRPEVVTVYPPGAQLAFLTLATVGADSIAGVRYAAFAAELTALLLVALALRRRRELTAGQLAVYAWSPLVISEVCVSGHIDALVLPLILAALLLAQARRGAWAGAVLGAATLLKLYPVVLLVAIPRSARRAAIAAAAAVVALTYLPWVALEGSSVLGFLPDYVRTGEDFNMAVRGFLQDGLALVTVHARPIAMATCAAVLTAVLLRLATANDAERDPFRVARDAALAFVLLLPTAVHPWYALWLVPLVAVSPSAAGLWLVGMLPLSYLKYSTATGAMPMWIPWVEFVPALALLVGERWLSQPTQPEAA